MSAERYPEARLAELREVAAYTLDKAKALGADAAEVYLRQGTEASVTVRKGEIEKLEEGSPRSIGVRVWSGAHVASTYATDLRRATIDGLLADTLALAPLTDAMPEQALADPARLADGAEALARAKALELFDPEVAAVDPARKVAIARELEASALGADPRVARSSGASYGDVSMTGVLANSNGFMGGYASSFAHYGVGVVADDEESKKRNGSWHTVARHIADLAPPAEVGRVAAERCVRTIGAGPVDTAVVPVVFDPRMAASLIAKLFAVLRGGAIERGASYLAGQLGETIGSPLLNLVDDPLRARGPGSRVYDGEGAEVAATRFVDAGVLRSYALNSYHARKLGMAPTGHASRPASGAPGSSSSNLYLEPGERTPEEIIGEIDYGFYCESMMGHGFQATTGDFSQGASGRLIEKGELTRPVSEVTISANFRELFAQLDAVANDLDFERSISAPTLRVARMTLAGR